ncbi:hypothetical protein DIZ76_011905 [Coccidioides immitis]|nr:hypothetical protein DIZ76_011905 [Coccidioides immitis]
MNPDTVPTADQPIRGGNDTIKVQSQTIKYTSADFSKSAATGSNQMKICPESIMKPTPSALSSSEAITAAIFCHIVNVIHILDILPQVLSIRLITLSRVLMEAEREKEGEARLPRLRLARGRLHGGCADPELGELG